MTRTDAMAAYRAHRTLAVATGKTTAQKFDSDVAKEVGKNVKDWWRWESWADKVCEQALLAEAA